MQYGFIPGKSTTTQLVEYVDALTQVLDNDGQTDGVYIDFAKAFESLPHDKLLSKLKYYGITGKVINWFESYLSNRQQRVVLSGHASKWLPVNSDVPQGSILGH